MHSQAHTVIDGDILFTFTIQAALGLPNDPP